MLTWQLGISMGLKVILMIVSSSSFGMDFMAPLSDAAGCLV